ncbi:S53 family peptidase [Rhodanobacter sp. C01]|uniref:S53 family peptidase n=1 Tax=Rhodanobacter sp. C01 TaxID=1945856 RepID=UPI0009853C4F|nr:S53 family peptidase [Rhodanobacter sp. C01]OOG45565.1 peptidase S53 [Rhodanobacter sp. C01]
MLAHLHRKTIAASLTLILAGFASTAFAGTAQPNIDMGVATSTQPVHVTLILKLHNQAALEQYIQQTVTQGSPNYHQFLSTSQFAGQYGATDAEIAKVQAYLQKQGLGSQVMANHMAIQTSGTLDQLGKAFQTSIHTYVSRSTGQSFHRPASVLVLPSALADTVAFASGLSNERKYLSHRLGAPAFAVSPKSLPLGPTTLSKTTSGNPTATGEPGEYTVGDVANFYNINPLYQHGITGKGSTVGIVTLSNFYPADAVTYWNDIGLATKPNRITQIHVDGGGAIDGGSGETSLDVEQSGGLAPFANVLVYDAPNSGNGFTDAFLRAVSDNKADSISTSWGLPEIFNFAALNVTGASDTDTSDAGDLQAFHQIFMEAAAQGQSVFVAAGDSGAYDTVRDLGLPGTAAGDYSAPLTVDSPASDPYATAAGGTTVPVTFYNAANVPVISITQENVWGWDYLQNYFNKVAPGEYDLFSTGGGGGVSVYWHQPLYQLLTQGIRTSEPKQSLVYIDPQAGPTTLLQLPSRFVGRNMPDLALNADPETGYIVISTYDGGLISGYGGTSFVAPQLNGISALLTQNSGHRIGFWNPQIYLLQDIFGSGTYSGFRDIRAGDNWFYYGTPGYDQGSGIGALNVANLAQFLKLGF